MMTPPPCKCGNDIYTIRSSAGTIICTQCEEERQWPEQEDIDQDNANTALLLDQQVGIKVMTAMIQMLRGYDFIDDINTSIEQAIDFNNLLPRMSNMFMTELIMQLEGELKNPNSSFGNTVREGVREVVQEQITARTRSMQLQAQMDQRIKEVYKNTQPPQSAMSAMLNKAQETLLDEEYEKLVRTYKPKHEDMPARKKLIDYVESMKKSVF